MRTTSITYTALAVVSALMIFVLAGTAPAHAQPRTLTPTTVKLVQDSTQTAYYLNVTFTATVYDQQGNYLQDQGNVTFTIDGVAYPGSVVNAAHSYGTNQLTAGSHTITATYAGDPNTAPSTSDAITHTVTKSSVDFTFQLPLNNPNVDPGQTLALPVETATNGQNFVPFGNGIFDFTVTGPTQTTQQGTLTYGNNSSIFNLLMPTQAGNYTIHGHFEGTANVNPVDATYEQKVHIAYRASIAFSTYPTPLVLGKPVDLVIKVTHAPNVTAANPPIPSGIIEIGYYKGYTQYYYDTSLDANGQVAVEVTVPTVYDSGTPLYIKYGGDTNYFTVTVGVPVAGGTPLPAPPSSTGNNGKPATPITIPSASATVGVMTPTSLPVPSPTTTNLAINDSSTSTSTNRPALSPDNHTNTGIIWLLAILGMLVLGAVVGIIVYRRQRASASPLAVTPAAPTFGPPAAKWQQPLSPFDDDITQF